MNSSLPFIKSLDGLESNTLEIYYVFVFPTLLVIGVILNGISLAVLIKILRKKYRQKSNSSNLNMFKYMLANELADFITCFISIFIFLSRCAKYCPIGYTYGAKLYDQYIFSFLGNNFSLWTLLNEISFSIERLKSFTAKKKEKKISFITLSLILFMISTIINLPHFVISRNVVPFAILTTTNQTLYIIKPSLLFNNKFGEIFLFVWALCRGLFLYILLAVLNIKIAINYKKHLFNKGLVINNIASLRDNNEELKKQKKETKITKMLFIMTGYYLFGNFPNSLGPIMFFIGLTDVYNYYGLFVNTNSVISHSSFLFLYLVYNV